MSYSVNMIHNIIPNFTNLFQEFMVGLNHYRYCICKSTRHKHSVQILSGHKINFLKNLLLHIYYGQYCNCFIIDVKGPHSPKNALRIALRKTEFSVTRNFQKTS